MKLENSLLFSASIDMYHEWF